MKEDITKSIFNDLWCKGLGQVQPKSDAYIKFRQLKKRKHAFYESTKQNKIKTKQKKEKKMKKVIIFTAVLAVLASPIGHSFGDYNDQAQGQYQDQDQHQKQGQMQFSKNTAKNSAESANSQSTIFEQERYVNPTALAFSTPPGNEGAVAQTPFGSAALTRQSELTGLGIAADIYVKAGVPVPQEILDQVNEAVRPCKFLKFGPNRFDLGLGHLLCWQPNELKDEDVIPVDA